MKIKHVLIITRKALFPQNSTVYLLSGKHFLQYYSSKIYHIDVHINKLLSGKLQKHKWENCMTIDKYSWGYRRNARLSDYLTIDDIVKTFVETVSCGGNMLMNVGPTRDGKIAPVFEERLRQLGQWLSVNGEGIYSTRPWSHQNDTVTKNVW